MNKQGILLGVVQILADLNLIIVKANMSYDGEWFMDGRGNSFSLFFKLFLPPPKNYVISMGSIAILQLKINLNLIFVFLLR